MSRPRAQTLPPTTHGDQPNCVEECPRKAKQCEHAATVKARLDCCPSPFRPSLSGDLTNLPASTFPELFIVAQVLRFPWLPGTFPSRCDSAVAESNQIRRVGANRISSSASSSTTSARSNAMPQNESFAAEPYYKDYDKVDQTQRGLA